MAIEHDLAALLAERDSLRAALRQHVICNHYKPGKFGDKVTGHSCDECGAVWNPDGPEQHKLNCIAAIRNS